MFQLEPQHYGALLPFVPDVPEATVPVHCLTAGIGLVYVDDLSSPLNMAVVVHGRGGADRVDAYLYGNPKSDDLEKFLTSLKEPTEVHGDDRLGELVKRVHDEAEPRETIVFSFARLADIPQDESDAEVRKLTAKDASEVGDLVPSWAWGVMGGTAEVLQAGAAFGATEEGKLVSAAFLTDASVKYETLSAFTDTEHRRQGHAFRCSQRLMAGTIERGRLPRVLVGVRHEAGIQLAAKLGFTSRTRVTSYFVDVF